MLLDGNSLTYRAFFALPTDLTTASGQVTNAVFGFTSMLVNLVRDHRPDGIVVTFDRPEPTFRHVTAPSYKATRDAAPDILRQQMGLVRQVLEVFDLPVVEQAGVEADDLIATLASRYRDAGHDVLVVTGDRDTYQLVEDPHIKVLYNKRGVSDYALYDEAGILERTGVRPVDYVQYAALRGDPSDNLPGVPGVGEKTAAKLINSYGSIDGIYAHVDDQTPKLRQNLAENEAQVRLNTELMVLRRDVEIDVEPAPFSSERVDAEALRQLIDFLEFHSLADRIYDAMGSDVVPAGAGHDVLVAEVAPAATPADAVAAIERLAGRVGALAVAGGTRQSVAWRDTSWEHPSDYPLTGLALVDDTEMGEVTWIPAEVMASAEVVEAIRSLVADGGRPLAAHDAKSLLRALAGLGIDVRTLALDTMLAQYLLDPAESRYLLEDMLERHCRLRLPDVSPAEEGRLDLGGDGDVDAATATAQRALAVSRLVDPLQEALDAHGLRALHDDIEVPLVRVLARMEDAGVGVDVTVLQKLSDELTTEAADLTRQIHDDAGGEFNVNSTKQLREILFERLALAPQKKTKTGFSTDAASLEKLSGQHPIIDHLLRYREVEKLRSTYGEGLLAEVASDDRIHATFNQTVARTGRLSSDAPNLHNIPVRTERGREFRRAFVPGEGTVFLVADYNQIELRCIAHLAEDPGLIGAFESGQDIHNATAARVFGVAPTEVTIEQRSKAKMVSYGLAYGMEAYGLGQRLNIPTDEAAVILDAYFAAFPAVHDYMDRTVEETRQRGYTETLFGRRRQIPELASSNFRIRQAGERQAMNAGIQGLAADIFKVALVRLDRALEDGVSRSRLVLQVHDEVILEVEPDDRDAMAALTVATMADAFDLRVPLEVNLSFGTSWADAKG
jgi:DNA polymerase I